ncbi:MAG: metallophosphoesterase [Bacteroidetes bacterium]|nr:metallophosphoesterase [Bacteroidota bacterium]
MKIQYCSDLHLEFPENQKFLFKNPLQISGDILVLAGDIVTFHNLEKARGFFDYVCDHYSAVYWVPGNHEYYGSDISDKPSPLCERLRNNLFLLNNHAIVHGSVRLVFTTLWSRIQPIHEWDIQRSISDFSAIKYNEKTFTTNAFSSLHEECLRFLTEALLQPNQTQTIVVTHHVPTLMNYPPIYKNSLLTEAFAVELFDLISDSEAQCWIYGHHHVNTPEFEVGKTRMLTNQLGYVRQYEHKTFRRGAVVEIK